VAVSSGDIAAADHVAVSTGGLDATVAGSDGTTCS